MMVNGRISDKSVKRYRYLHSMLSDMIGTMTKFAMQSPIDAEYIMRLGAPPELVTVTGNTKFDQTYTDVSAEEKAQILREMNLEDNEGIFLAGSTHRGEEEFVLQAFKAVRKSHPKARLVIAPRELLRTMEVTHICKSAGFTVSLRTELQKEDQHGEPTDIVILDTAPIGTVIDAAILTKYADGAALVAESEVTSRRGFQHAKEQLDLTGVRFLGVIINKVNMSKDGYYGYSRYGKYGKYGK